MAIAQKQIAIETYDREAPQQRGIFLEKLEQPEVDLTEVGLSLHRATDSFYVTNEDVLIENPLDPEPSALVDNARSLGVLTVNDSEDKRSFCSASLRRNGRGASYEWLLTHGQAGAGHEVRYIMVGRNGELAGALQRRDQQHSVRETRLLDPDELSKMEEAIDATLEAIDFESRAKAVRKERSDLEKERNRLVTAPGVEESKTTYEQDGGGIIQTVTYQVWFDRGSAEHLARIEGVEDRQRKTAIPRENEPKRLDEFAKYVILASFRGDTEEKVQPLLEVVD